MSAQPTSDTAAPRYAHWRLEQDPDKILWLTLDVQGTSVNVLSPAVLSELAAILDTLPSHPQGPAVLQEPSERKEHGPLQGLAFRSGKTNGFIAGADIKAFTRLADRAQALDLIQAGQHIITRIAELSIPTAAVINGFCMGGGTELALACDYRIALDDPKTRIGLPEVQLGIHPGFGGTVRAIQVLGPLPAMDLMLTGRPVDARTARRLGLVDTVVVERYLTQAARDVLLHPPERRSGLLKRAAHLLNYPPLRGISARVLRRKTAAKVNPAHYPAPFALIDLWAGYGNDPPRMLEHEAESVADLVITSTARNLVRVFLLKERLKGLAPLPPRDTPYHVHLIGGGVMGGDIAAWCVLQGLTVSLQDSRLEALGAAHRRAAALFRRQLKSTRLINAALDRLTGDPHGAGLTRADAVIEAVFEDLAVKQALFEAIEPKIRPEAILATNTSSIRLETLAQGTGARRPLKRPERLVGLHFFNPVAKMPLVEVVRGAQTDAAVFDQALAFVRRIDKLPLPVKSAPGFLVNRVLMPYLLEAVRLTQEGVPIAVIDQAARDFGMPIGPIELADTVGLDVCLNVAQVLARDLGAEVPARLTEQVRSGRLGVKSGAGFYAYQDGKAIKPPLNPDDPSSRQAIAQQLIGRLTDEAALCLQEGIVEDADLVDAGLIFGAGFAPFRGGPLHDQASRGVTRR